MASTGVPIVKPGEKISELIINACQLQELVLNDNDIVVITQKIVIKS